MRRGLTAAIAAGWLACTSLAQAVAVDFGTAEYVTIRDCVPGTTSACDSISSIIQGSFGGFPGASSSSATTSLPGYGSAQGEVSLSGVVGAPILKARAVSGPGARTNTNSVALQRYTYTGATATTRTFGGTLTYAQTVTGPYGTGVGDGVYAAMDVFTLPGDTVDVGDNAESNFFALINSLFGLTGYLSLGSDSYTDATSTASGSAALDVTVTLDPGDSVWVWVLLQTPAANDADVDAWNTLKTGWDDAADLVPAVVASLPEPDALALVGVGLLALATRRRRRA